MKTIWVPDLSDHAGPRYRAIAEAVARAVAAGELAVGDRLPTHRALADALGVTVGTVTRGYAEAERRGLVSARVGSGTYVRSPQDGSGQGFSVAPAAEDGDIDFGLAFPVPMGRTPALADALRDLAGDDAALAECLGYHPEAGLPRHRTELARWLRGWGYGIDAGHSLICLGALHGLNMALQAVARPGETVASAGLVYPGMIAAARGLGLRHLPLASDGEGVQPGALEAACRQHAVRAVYLTPDQNNPTAEVIPGHRRDELLAVAGRHDVAVIEDAVHLVAAAERPSALVDRAPERVIHITGVSKVLAGGLRVGLVQAPPRWFDDVAQALRGNCWMAPPLNAEAACRWIDSGAADELARRQREEIAARQALVAEHFQGLAFAAQPYGFNVWLHLPEPWRADEFARACAAEGVRLKTGEPFAVGRHPVPQAVRLAISAPAARERVAEGLARVRRVLERGPGRGGATL
ncbi:PLP-dependent aminotransferase family protein [Arhodomonas aquaeolei]|uniref:aminotransferase-like domain-containing protein n=1 Tax=Arhodomonas aquaeolei TaxID=2369 RepID=UPI00037B1E41|nr:PLP-dependent aminotransferase family protein [Arhodomonas aquaeolei]